MDLEDFDYHLPAERIAQEPPADRAAARMLVVDCAPTKTACESGCNGFGTATAWPRA